MAADHILSPGPAGDGQVLGLTEAGPVTQCRLVDFILQVADLCFGPVWHDGLLWTFRSLSNGKSVTVEFLQAKTCYALYWPESWNGEDLLKKKKIKRSEWRMVAFGGEMQEAPRLFLSCKGKTGPEGVARWLRILLPLAEDPSSSLCTNVRCVTTACHFNSGQRPPLASETADHKYI